ncbi:LysR family transcriptional regulator, partial [Mesorhizobium sp. M7A.F.Ca.CA.001.13.1.1]|uniref:LysR family transcriptional regulator n=1 Tax=Mesorhizobium sp. M7A.F.Ca.CA.001.13.1.1 TaxID=2496728 RepID=UPI0013DEEBE0
ETAFIDVVFKARFSHGMECADRAADAQHRIFLAVYNLGNISKAAARENIASSAISKRLHSLESELGAPLFYRHSRGVEATPAGEMLAKHAATLFSQINRMTSEMSTFASGVAGQVRIHAHTSAIVQYMPSQIASFTKAYPSVKIILVEDSSLGVLQATIEGLTDIGILAGNMAFPDALDVFDYRHDKLVVLVPAGHPLSTSGGVRFADTLGFDHVGLAVTSSLGTLLAGAADALSMTLKTCIEVKTFESAVRMVEAGLGITILPDGVLADKVGNDRVCAIPLLDEWSTRPHVICVRNDRQLTTAALFMLDHLRSVP